MLRFVFAGVSMPSPPCFQHFIIHSFPQQYGQTAKASNEMGIAPPTQQPINHGDTLSPPPSVFLYFKLIPSRYMCSACVFPPAARAWRSYDGGYCILPRHSLNGHPLREAEALRPAPVSAAVRFRPY